MRSTATPKHPYSVLGGGTDGVVHGPPSHFVERHDYLKLMPEARLTYATTKSGHRIYYSRCWGGEFRERAVEESDAGAGPIKIILVQGLAGTHAIWYVAPHAGARWSCAIFERRYTKK